MNNTFITMRLAAKSKSMPHAVMVAIIIKVAFVVTASLLPINLLVLTSGAPSGNSTIINYAPEVWLSLLALVFGTLIIVISIASESTPKLIDLFVGDYRSRLFIWLITLSSLENIYLQLLYISHIDFFDNLIFLNGYVLLPGSVLLAIPYTFYILKYTRNSNVIKKIYDANLRTQLDARQLPNDLVQIDRSQFNLFDTINQLHDLLQYIQFKEPKGDIIHRMGKSLRFYLGLKKKFRESYFKLGNSAKKDICFRTLSEKYAQIENEKIFYEEKVLRVLGGSYLLLMRDSYYDLTSLCCHEMYETGKVAADLGETRSTYLVLRHFNTLIRYGINHSLKTKEIRNVYNTIFHYGRLVTALINKREEAIVVRCCQYLGFYGNELIKFSRTASFLVFLIDAFGTELKKILILLHTSNFPRDKQMTVLKIFNDMSSYGRKKSKNRLKSHNSDIRLIQIALCLFYEAREEAEFNQITMQCILDDIAGYDKSAAKNIIGHDLEYLKNEGEEFWEETDQGNSNVFYTPNKDQLGKFKLEIFEKIENDFASKIESVDQV